ncbi:immunoglobulin-like domain-containing protein [Gracilibacillus dipsosauri]|uniref:immunoglobulin-like domain-containing protein n=1 Tax=Gracilibacillus dipsosauri TaxID=178340 RepID=UPI002409C170
MSFKKSVALWSVFILIFQLLTPSIHIAANEINSEEENGLILHYNMSNTIDGEGVQFENLAGSDFNGILRNPSNGNWFKNNELGFIELFGGSASQNSAYIEIPKDENGKDLLSDLDSVTVSTLVNWTNDGQNRWLFGFGKVNQNIETGNSYYFASPRHGFNNLNVPATGISEAGWRNETLITANKMMESSVWKVVTSVFDNENDKIILYVDGIKVGEDSTEGKELANIIDENASFSGFIGKSIFQNDAYLKGLIGDFKVYNRALSSSEVEQLYIDTTSNITKLNDLLLETTLEELDITNYLHNDDDVQSVKSDIELPSAINNRVNIEWSSSNTDIISIDGKVTRPTLAEGDSNVELTATLSYGDRTISKTFDLIVLQEFDNEQRATMDLELIELYNPSNVKGNLSLPVSGENGSTIIWESSHPTIIKGSAESRDDSTKLGWVTRPINDTVVTLTAKVTYLDATVEKDFEVTVKKDPGEKEYNAYFFSYFTGEYEGGEEISFSVAKDPLKWKALNNGQSVLQSTMGEKGLRDPFIIRSPEGDKFYLIATDLKMGESTNFDQAQITGSHAIMVWESDDLVNWSDQRMVEVAPKNAGNTWAPEAFYHEATGEYVVFWASSIPNDETYGNYPNGRPNGQYNVMYYATTRDFQHFSEPKVYIDDSFPTIDTTFIKEGDTYYRFTKSEVNFKVYYEKANDIFYDKDNIKENGYQFESIGGTKSGNLGLIGHGGNNEGQTIFKDLHEDKWYLFLDSWPYHVRYTTDLEDGNQLVENVVDSSEYALPPGPRHGTVIPITDDEYEALVKKYLPVGPETNEKPVIHYGFDEVENKIIKDLSGNQYDAQLVGGATINEDNTIGNSKGSLQLDGNTGHVALPNNLIQSLNLEKMTIATWVKTDRQQADQRIFDFASETGRTANRNTMYLSAQGDSNQLEFAVVTPFTEKFNSQSQDLSANYKYMIKSNQLTTNQWNHVTVTIDDFEAIMYVNGEEVARNNTFNVEPRMLMETTMNYIGKSSNNSHPTFAGQLDEFKVFNRALTEEEIIELANQDFEKPPTEEPTEPLLLLDYDMNLIEDDMVKDSTGNFDGKINDISSVEHIRGEAYGAIHFSGDSGNIEIPEGLLAGQKNITISSLINWDGEKAAEWLFALGQNDKRYLYFTPRYNADNNLRAGIATDGWRNEASVKAGEFSSGEWKLVTLVFNGTEGKLDVYLDGKFVASESVPFTLAEIEQKEGISGYIGKSFYSADPNFKGMIADFEVYSGALNAKDIENLYSIAQKEVVEINRRVVEEASEQLTIEKLLGNNKDSDNITENLSLLYKSTGNTTITWESSDLEWIAADGSVKRPSNQTGSKQVKLIASITDGTSVIEKEFVFTVLEMPATSILLIEAVKDLVIYNVEDVRGNLTLPQYGKNDTVITWTTSDSSIITTTGEVRRPAYGEGDKEITLVATLKIGSEYARKTFKANVKEMPQQEDKYGYLFSYFTGEGYTNGEQIYFALSEGNDPLHWNVMNDGNPTITSNLGEKGLRDPFIIRSPEGDKFFMIATDLKINGNWDWGKAQSYGSRSIMVWESTDLVNWSNQRLVEVAPEAAGNTWAPEIFYDDTTGEYIVFWASKLYENEEQRETGSTYQRMMYAKTRDFYTFTEPEVYMDYGYSIIDTTMIEDNGNIYRFTKDERGNSSTSPNGKFIFQEVGESVLDPSFELLKEGIGKGDISQGEGPAIFKSNTEEKWYLFIDEFGGRGYVPFETTDLASGEWTIPDNYDLPSRPRHGTVLPLTKTEYENLANKVPSEMVETDPAIQSITFEKESLEISVDDTFDLDVNVNASMDVSLQWTSGDEEIVSVNEQGTITGLKVGKVYITVSDETGKFTDLMTVTVHEKEEERPQSIHVHLNEEIEVYSNATIHIIDTKAKIKLPTDLPDGTIFIAKDVDWNAIAQPKWKLAGEIFDFHFRYPDGTEEPSNPFEITLGITDMDDSSSIYYYDEQNKAFNKIEGIFNKDMKTLTAEVSHFSIYGVLNVVDEIPEEEQEGNISEEDIGDGNSGTDDDELGNGGDKGDNGDSIDKVDQSKNNSTTNSLPDTSTTIYNILLIGIVFVLIGFLLYLFRVKKYRS